MILYDGKYSWKGSTTTRKRPISWWRSSYQVRIIDASRDAGRAVLLKPHIVLLADTGEGASVTNCLPDLAKRICNDFKLDVNRVLWVEDRPETRERFWVAMFRSVARIAGDVLYQVSWRTAAPAELRLIEKHCV